MSLLFEKLAKYVAKILLSIAILALMAVAVDAQKRSVAKGKPKPSTKYKKYKKPTGKSVRRLKAKIPKPVLPKILAVPYPVHREMHFTKESWTDAIVSNFIVVSSRPNGGMLLFRVMGDTNEQNFSIKVDPETAYIVPTKQKNGELDPEGCFMMVYCKIHNTALIFSQVQCF